MKVIYDKTANQTYFFAESIADEDEILKKKFVSLEYGHGHGSHELGTYLPYAYIIMQGDQRMRAEYIEFLGGIEYRIRSRDGREILHCIIHNSGARTNVILWGMKWWPKNDWRWSEPFTTVSGFQNFRQ
jgi:hypothetical protein